jgi:aminoglycoside phosphotransferase (APT) family kinase protein
VETPALVTAINAAHGTAFVVAGRFTGGEGSGASELRDADGSLWVLKTSDGPGLDFDRAARTARLRALGYPAPATRLTGEIGGMHFDFTAPNTLAADGVVTGVIDWEGTVTGDRAFDLVTQSLYAYQSARRDRLLDAARARTAPGAIQLYAAHMVLRQVDWTIRHHEPLVAEFFTQLGVDLLGAVGAAPDQPTY